MTIKEDLYDLETKVSKGLKEAYKKMVAFKKYKKTPLVVSENGKILEILPEDIPLTTGQKDSNY